MDLHCVPSHLAAAPSHQAALTHRAETSRPIAIRQSSLPFQAEKHLGDLRLSLRISVLRTTADAKQYTGQAQPPLAPDGQDRKSTRLNSSHLVISYAVFCLKKKKKNSKIANDTSK